MAEENKKEPEAKTAAPADAAKAPAEAKDSEKKEGADAAAPKTSAAQSPWLPLIVVIIILPLLSFAMNEYLIIPRVKKALGEVVKIQQETVQPVAGGPLPTEHTKAKKKTKPAGGHGGGHGEAAAADTGSVKFENIVANLSGSMKSRFVKVSFTIEGDDEEFKTIVDENKVKIIDSALGILGALTVAELDEPGMKNIVRSDLIDSFNQVLEKPVVLRLYFSEFVIQ